MIIPLRACKDAVLGHYLQESGYKTAFTQRERGGLVLEHWPENREIPGFIPKRGTLLCL